MAAPQSHFSVAMSTALHEQLVAHLDRDDGQEDLCFALWQSSQGGERSTALLTEVILPRDGDRNVHGNVSFNAPFLMRAAERAVEVGGGIALLHSHPSGTGWQRLSKDDWNAESGHAGRVSGLTSLPMVGLTLATGDGTWSARRWDRTAPRVYAPTWARSVRVVGDRLRLSWDPELVWAEPSNALLRTAGSWGFNVQHTLQQLHIAVVGAGSVGALVVEILARIGVGRISVLDFDTVKFHNLDRLLHATRSDAWLATGKAELAVRAARRSATAVPFRADALDCSAIEPDGLQVLRDCDLVFSCVDRPAGRAALNALAYAHLIPVVDGGILVDPGRTHMRGAEWRAHVAAPGRRCLECLGQYDPALVQTDRDGLLDDPTYLAQLPADLLERRSENVFAFSTAAAAAEVLAALRMLIAPGGCADAGAQLFHFATGDVDTDTRGCDPGCLYQGMVAAGDASGLPIPSRHVTAERERASRASTRRRPSIRLLRAMTAAADKLAETAEHLAGRLPSREAVEAVPTDPELR
jgi:hypothetical protein